MPGSSSTAPPGRSRGGWREARSSSSRLPPSPRRLSTRLCDLDDRPRGRASARDRQACRAGRPSGAGSLGGDARPRARRRRGRRRRGAARNRAPARSRHLGLLVVAKSEPAYARLQSLVRERALEREYTALVHGRPRSLRGRIEAPIGRDRHDPLRHSLDTDTPRAAVTHFEVVELLRRAHAAAGGSRDGADAPDPRPPGRDRASGLGRSALRRKGDLGLSRQFLHASRLAFPHPITGERVECESPLPDDLAAALDRARRG